MQPTTPMQKRPLDEARIPAHVGASWCLNVKKPPALRVLCGGRSNSSYMAKRLELPGCGAISPRSMTKGVGAL